MPSLDHEAPLVVLREQPRLVATLVQDGLGLPLPAFATVEIGDAGLTQAMPAELRADLVVHLRGGPPEHAIVMGIIVEVQRARDDDKRWSWPLYVAALHARLACPTCLIVLATDDAVARWAARPITTLQPGSPFVPLVLGPDRIPRVAIERARQEPWMAVLSGLVHGNRVNGTAATLAALEALGMLPEHLANVCYDLIRGSLNEAARRALEEEMQPGKYEYRTEFARRYFGEGRQEGMLEGARAVVLSLVDRHGAVEAPLRERVAACADPERLRTLAVDLARAPDLDAVGRLLEGLSPTVAVDE